MLAIIIFFFFYIFTEDLVQGHLEIAATINGVAVVEIMGKVAGVEAEVLNVIMREDIVKCFCSINSNKVQI